MVLYLVLTYLIRKKRVGVFFDQANALIINHIFDATTFAGSIMLLWGIVDPVVLAAIGNTKLFLLIAGLAGVAYSLQALKYVGANGNGQ